MLTNPNTKAKVKVFTLTLWNSVIGSHKAYYIHVRGPLKFTF